MGCWLVSKRSNYSKSKYYINISKESLPDPDLGHTNKFGFRNTTKEGDQNRVFGTPTIRDDITRKTQKSIADPNVPYIININQRTTVTKNHLSNFSSPRSTTF
jgi:hypothetical protein